MPDLLTRSYYIYFLLVCLLFLIRFPFPSTFPLFIPPTPHPPPPHYPSPPISSYLPLSFPFLPSPPSIFLLDSVFVHLKGRTKAEAFRIGKEIAEKITQMSPPDVVLKFEKVYLPCVLISKKR